MEEKIGEIANVLRLASGTQTYFFGVFRSDKTRAITFVPAIEAGQQNYLEEILEDGYQRPGSPSRMRAFAKFLSNNPNSVVPPIVLSGRDRWKFVEGENPGIGKLELYGPAAIVDGQHRAGGYVALHEKEPDDIRQVSFILLDGLTIEEESQDFRDINNSQKGVPRQLTAYLEQTESAQIAWALNEDPDSPFFRRITRTTMAKQHLFALHSVARQMTELFKMGGLSDLDLDVKINIASEYFTIISDVWQEQWADIELLDDADSAGRRSFSYKLLELTGLIAWCRVGSTLLHRCYSSDLGMNWEKVRELVAIAGNIDWSKEGKFAGRTGLAGAKVVVEEMESLLTRDAPVSADIDVSE